MIVSWGYRDESGKYKNLKYSTGQSVNPDKWDKKIYQAKGKYSSGVNIELENIRYNVNKSLSETINPIQITFHKADVNSTNSYSSAEKIDNFIPKGLQNLGNSIRNFYFAQVVPVAVSVSVIIGGCYYRVVY